MRGLLRSTMILGLWGILPDGAGAQLPVGDPFPVNVELTNDQSSPAIGMANDGRFSILWQDSSNSQQATDIVQRNFQSNGTPGAPSTFNQTLPLHQTGPAISMNGSGDSLSVWRSATALPGSVAHLLGRRTTTSGTILGNEFQLNEDESQDVRDPRVSRAEDGTFVTVWHDGSAPAFLLVRRFAANGTASTGDLVVSSPVLADEGYDVATAPDGSFVVVWVRSDTSFQGILARCFDSSADPIGEEFVVNEQQTFDQIRPAVATDDSGGFVVAWIDEFPELHLAFRRFGPDCSPISSQSTIVDSDLEPEPADAENPPRIDRARDGAFVISWGFSDNVRAQEFTKSGKRVEDPFFVNNLNGSLRPDVAISDATFAIAWQATQSGTSFHDVHARRYIRRVLFDDDFETGDLFYWSGSQP